LSSERLRLFLQFLSEKKLPLYRLKIVEASAVDPRYPNSTIYWRYTG